MAFPVLPPFTTTPNRNNPATFSADTDQYHLELTPFVPLLNTWATEANTLGQETQDARDIAVNAKDIALSTVNYKGDYVSGTYNLNESVTYSDGFNYVSKINGNTDIPNTSNWYRVPNIDDNAITNYQMWSSSKIDTELATLENNLTTEINKKVNIDGNQTINNIKTFSESPFIPALPIGDRSNKSANSNFVYDNFMIANFDDPANCDTLLKQGSYRLQPTTSNSPFSGLWSLIVTGNGINAIGQLATLINTSRAGDIYSRTYNGTSWTDWMLVNIGLGVGQTLVDESSRLPNVVYTNTTGRPIFISICVRAVSPGSVFISDLYINGAIKSTFYTGDTPSGQAIFTHTYILNAGDNCKISGSGLFTIEHWDELK